MRKKKWTAAEKAVREEAAERLAHLMLATIEEKAAKRKGKKTASSHKNKPLTPPYTPKKVG